MKTDFTADAFLEALYPRLAGDAFAGARAAESAAAIAPRPLLIESGERDPLFPIEGAREAHERARRVYAMMNAADALTVDVFDGEHCVNGAASFAFLSD